MRRKRFRRRAAHFRRLVSDLPGTSGGECATPPNRRVQVEIGPASGPADAVTARRRTAVRPLSRRLERTHPWPHGQRLAPVLPAGVCRRIPASLTPCVYPVVPIVMGFVGSRSGNRKMRGFVLSLFFVLGLSLVYSILGVAAALTGSLVGISFQNPVVVSVVALIFLAMGLSMAGLFSSPSPRSSSARRREATGARSGPRSSAAFRRSSPPPASDRC